MTHVLPPAIWLIVLIVGLPQLSETVYTPSLPDIAHTLLTSEGMVEYTLTIYLFGFAFGTLFWGRISDKLGRKPCIIAGLLLFIFGCVGCYFSNSIEMLMISRLVQAFGGSIGSVLGQAICRDAFHGPALGMVYSTIGSALALFPALGPLCGGLIAEMFGWRNIFVFLILFALIVTFLVSMRLPETYASRKQVSMCDIAKQLLTDKKVLGFALIVAGCNGILFSYFAEGSFYLIKGLNLSPSH
ncbi:MFS transporter N-terminal domain protein [Candidatus Cyrtobacter comes]|uniref:Bcr/CflA family efflux transporter n=1 Tax=Candidatus Cyrtobacter comes TaxID=675776 RepID=A0ABU5L954_9RICK|nr:Bcr/CflA family efflux MFS transporter [Candidatus Cyrtobacter comes]MDZ5762651.1 MFS transporter N-terminal domain protein [Candidatus Cyrtobacter comes]